MHTKNRQHVSEWLSLSPVLVNTDCVYSHISHNYKITDRGYILQETSHFNYCKYYSAIALYLTNTHVDMQTHILPIKMNYNAEITQTSFFLIILKAVLIPKGQTTEDQKNT